MTNKQLDVISTEELIKIGTFIRENADRLIEDWEGESREDNVNAREELRAQLRNQLPDFLAAYANMLCLGNRGVPGELAVLHGAHRWATGWDLASVTRDFMILRSVLVRSLSRDLDVPPSVINAVTSALDVAVCLCVQRYVQDSERELAGQNEKLTRSNYELKRFAHMVAHEVRNPLGTMIMAIELLRKQVGEMPGLDSHFRMIGDSRLDLIDVINSLLNFADIEITGTRRDEEVDLNIAFAESVHQLDHLVAASEASITCTELPTVSGDRVALRSVFMNLIENAIKYAGNAPPEISVTAIEEDDTWWDIQVSDKGAGIAEKHKGLVFRFMGRACTDPAIPGSGVGLAFCKRVVEQHGGTISVESTLGKGSTFHVRLPKQEPSPPDA